MEATQTPRKAALIQPAILVGGLILYAAVRIGVDSFYSEFGATPDEVGLSYATTLTRAAVGLVAYGVFGALLALVVTIGGALNEESSKTKKSVGALILYLVLWGGSLFVVLGFGVAIFDLFSEGIYVVERVPSWSYLVGVAFVPVVALLFWPTATGGWKIFILVIILVSVATIGTRVQARGRELAFDVRYGEVRTPSALFSVLPIAASCVTFQWVDVAGGGPTEPTPEGKFLYLGGADDTALLLKAEQSENPAVLYRLPESSIRITHEVADDAPVLTRCHRVGVQRRGSGGEERGFPRGPLSDYL